MENKERKIWWKMLFSTVWLKKENRRESFPSRPTFFILPIWKENGERKVLRNVFYTNTLSPTPHFIHDLMTCFGLFYFWQHCLFFFFFWFSRLPFFFFFFLLWVETLFVCLFVLFCFVFFVFFCFFLAVKFPFLSFFFFFLFFFWFPMCWALFFLFF